MAPSRERRGAHDPGVVLRDMAVSVADGGERVSDLGVLRGQEACSERWRRRPSPTPSFSECFAPATPRRTPRPTTSRCRSSPLSSFPPKIWTARSSPAPTSAAVPRLALRLPRRRHPLLGRIRGRRPGARGDHGAARGGLTGRDRRRGSRSRGRAGHRAHRSLRPLDLAGGHAADRPPRAPPPRCPPLGLRLRDRIPPQGLHHRPGGEGRAAWSSDTAAGPGSRTRFGWARRRG